jgi:hypothetical protein
VSSPADGVAAWLRENAVSTGSTTGDGSTYLDRSGRDLSSEEWAFYEVFGLFRLASIMLERRCRRLIREAGR